MKLYQVQYLKRGRKQITISPYTGKPYKRPQYRCLHCDVTELIEAETIEDALSKAIEKARQQQWEVQRIIEIAPYLQSFIKKLVMEAEKE